MTWPLVLRTTHEKALKLREGQIVALARLLYPDGVPEEFQLLLGITVPQKPAIATKAEEIEIEPEPELSPMQEAANLRERDKGRDLQRLTSLARTNPSRLGPELTRVMARDIVRRAEAARPNHMANEVFERARREAEGQ